jgi:MFS family permease
MQRMNINNHNNRILLLACQEPRQMMSEDKSKYYVLALLCCGNLLSTVDRNLIALVASDIQADFHLSDTQLSLLMGLAFVLFYAVAGIPIARIADRSTRKWVVATGILLWSLMTSLTAFSKSFVHFLGTRMGVGVGEASLTPSAYSLLGDLFSREKLSMAIGIFGLGAGLGWGAALLLGGTVLSWLGNVQSLAIPFIGEIHRWQVVFLALGLPGIALSALVALTVREPRRAELFSKRDTYRAPADPKGTLRDAVRVFRSQQTIYSWIFIGMSLNAVVGYGFLSWMPTYMIRSFGWSPSETGLRLGIAVVLGGAGSTVAAGYVTNLLFARGYSDGPIRASIAALLVAAPLLIAAVTTDHSSLAVGLYTSGLFFVLMPATLSAIAVQYVTPNRQRATMAAAFVLTLNLVGFGLGPIFVALVTDHVFHSSARLGDSLLIVTACMLPLSIAGYLVCLPSLRRTVGGLMALQDRAEAPGSRGILSGISKSERGSVSRAQ